MKPKPRSTFAAALLLAAFTLTARAGSPMQTQGEKSLADKDYLTALPLLQQAAEIEKDNKQTWAALRAEVETCKSHLTASQIAKVSWSVGAAPAAVKIPPRTTHAPPQPGEIRTLAIKELGNFEVDPEKAGSVPDDVLKLDGMKVNMWGFMIPNLQAGQVTEFVLVPSLTGCCYGQPPAVQHTILVHAQKTPVAYTTKPIRIIGTLHVKEKRESDYTIGIFELEPDSIQTVNIDMPSDVMQGKAQLDLQNEK